MRESVVCKQKGEWKTIPRIMLCAPSSGSGKTVFTCGLLKVLERRGMTAAAFKCGPDYIDPLFHREVLKVESRNLDGFFQNQEEMQDNFMEGCLRAGERSGKKRADIGIIEGVMGFFDGLGGISSRASSWETARWLDCPVILILDGKSAGLSAAALVQGFLTFSPEKEENSSSASQRQNKIAGILLNQTSAGLSAVQKELLEERFSLPVLGYLPKLKNLHLESRHLGLVLPEEVSNLDQQLEELADTMEKTIDIEGLLRTAKRKAESAIQPDSVGKPCIPASSRIAEKKKTSVCRIGIAWDKAFCFYYPDNLNYLEYLGAELFFFSPLQDQQLPDDVDGLILGGGYPELYAEKLSKNQVMRQEIAQAADRGMPILGECGGFLYLSASLEDSKGEEYPMAGVFAGKGYNRGKLERFGYLSLYGEEDGWYLKRGECIRGHEFHYWDSTINGEMGTAKKPMGKKSWKCMCQKKRVFAGFPHLYYPSFPLFSQRFIEQGKAYRQER